LVKQLKLDLPPQPPPRITAPATTIPFQPLCSGDFRAAPVDITHFFAPIEKVGLAVSVKMQLIAALTTLRSERLWT
jgi:hypothetical protein